MSDVNQAGSTPDFAAISERVIGLLALERACRIRICGDRRPSLRARPRWPLPFSVWVFLEEEEVDLVETGMRDSFVFDPLAAGTPSVSRPYRIGEVDQQGPSLRIVPQVVERFKGNRSFLVSNPTSRNVTPYRDGCGSARGYGCAGARWRSAKVGPGSSGESKLVRLACSGCRAGRECLETLARCAPDQRQFCTGGPDSLRCRSSGRLLFSCTSNLRLLYIIIGWDLNTSPFVKIFENSCNHELVQELRP